MKSLIEFEKIDVTIRLIEPMLGTVAKDPEVYKRFIESKKPAEVKGDESSTVDQTNTEDLELRGWTGFHKDKEGLFVYDYVVKGFLKNAGNILKDQVNVKALKSKINNQVFVIPRILHLGVDEPHEVLERPLRAQTPQGPRVSLVRSDVVNAGTELSFSIKWIKGNSITENLLKTILSYGECQGLGQWRNGGYGAFEVVSVTSHKKKAQAKKK